MKTRALNPPKWPLGTPHVVPTRQQLELELRRATRAIEERDKNYDHLEAKYNDLLDDYAEVKLKLYRYKRHDGSLNSSVIGRIASHRATSHAGLSYGWRYI